MQGARVTGIAGRGGKHSSYSERCIKINKKEGVLVP